MGSRTVVLIILCFAIHLNSLISHCINWTNLPNRVDMENAYVIYRTALKEKKTGGISIRGNGL